MIEMEVVADELAAAVEGIARELRAVDAGVARHRPRPDSWSVQEILGHLIDSAANNQQRIVRGHVAAELNLDGYDGDEWVRAQDYQSCSWPELIDFWRLYNLQLARSIRRLPAAQLAIECRIGDREPMTLGEVIAEYLPHLQHHVQQMRMLVASGGVRPGT